jgi:hypothetical protein
MGSPDAEAAEADPEQTPDPGAGSPGNPMGAPPSAADDAAAVFPDAGIFTALPGAGPALAPRLLAALGTDRKRFHHATELSEYTGIAPVTERSGKKEWVHWRWAASTFLRQTFHEFAGLSIQQSEWARAHYDLQRERGKNHHAAVRSVAFKWIRVIFRCWKDRTPYDEQRYHEALRRRGSPLAQRLTSIPRPA